MRTFFSFGFLLCCAFGYTQVFNRAYEYYEGNGGLNVFIQENGYCIIGTGYSDVFDGWDALKILKVDSTGTLQWKKQIGKKYYKYSAGGLAGGKVDADGNYILASAIGDSATGGFDAWLVKLNQYGDTLWTSTIKGSPSKYFHECEILPDGSILAVGLIRTGSGYSNLYVVRFSSTGQVYWEKNYGGAGSEEGFAIEITPDGGFVVAGTTDSYGPLNKNVWIMKADPLGNLLWQKTFGTDGNDVFAKVTKSRHGGYYLYAYLDSSFGNGSNPTDNAIIKLDENGNIVWRKDILTSKYSEINELKEYNDCLVFCGGTTDENENSVGWLVKTDLLGNIIWQRTYEYPTSPVKVGWFTDFKKTNDDGYIVTGSINNVGEIFLNRQDFWLVKVDSNGCLYPTTACVTGITETQTLQATLYPNPATNTLTIELPAGGEGRLTLYNLLGQEVFGTATNGQQTTVGLSLPPGVYLYRITQGTQHANGKLLVE